MLRSFGPETPKRHWYYVMLCCVMLHEYTLRKNIILCYSILISICVYKLEPFEGIHKVVAKVCWLKLSRDA